jgi:FkbM family methyltransferase
MSSLFKVVKKIKKQFIKLKRNRWERFQNNGQSFLVHNYKNLFNIRLYKDSYLSEEIYRNMFEPDEAQFIHDYLKKGDIFVDIGTNIGLYSLMAAKKVGVDGKVYSFEPVNKTYQRFLENIEINKFKNIISVRKALSDSSGEFEINVSCDGFDGWNSFASIIRGSESIKEMVETITFDSFFRDEAIWDRISLIKIDVEGWEKFVLLGGEEHFKRPICPTIIIEFVDQNTKNAGYSCKELYLQLKSYGYEIYNINNQIIQKEEQRESYEYSNLVATKDIQNIIHRLTNWTII